MGAKRHILIPAAILLFAATLRAQVPSDKNAKPSDDDSDVRLPVTKADVKIVQRAREILNSPSKWTHADTRVCPPEATTFSLYCALEKATNEVSGSFKHRGAAMQEARFVIDEIAPHKNYNHRLMDYNNDSTTTFPDVQKVLRLLEERIAKRLTEESQGSKK